MNLVVLAACQSAQTTDFSFSNEFSEINTAFLDAGAASIIATLYEVNDDISKKFVKRFYRELAKNKPKDIALQEAQRYIRKEHPNPKDWAAFILSGSVSPISI